MTCRGLKLNSDMDQILGEENFEAVLKKFMLTKNCKKEAALRWALQRATTDAERKFINTKIDEYFKSGEGLI